MKEIKLKLVSMYGIIL